MMDDARASSNQNQDWSEFVRLDASILYGSAHNPEFLFRGQAREEWSLEPSLVRIAQSGGWSASRTDAYPIVLTLARTGLRIGEALTLQADDIDLTQHGLWVRRTWGSRRKALGNGRINAPKSNRIRRVDMSAQLARVLQGLLAVREAEAILKARTGPSWLFLEGDGGPITPGAFWQNIWRPLLRRTGLRYRKPHTLRHTWASLLIQGGESLAYIRDHLGHHSIKLTVDTYGHLVPGANRAAVDRLDDATGRNLYATSR